MLLDLQKASMLKRISAWILDAIVVSILATGFGLLISSIIGYDARFNQLNACYGRYEAEYGINIEIAPEDYEALTEAELAVYAEALEAMNQDAELNYCYRMIMNMSLVIVTVGILLAFLIYDFLVPIFLKNGQTVGKKIFEIGLMQTDHTKLKTVSLAIRTFLGKFAVETMIPVLLVIMIYFGFAGFGATIVIGVLLLLQIIALAKTRTNSAIHDLLAATVAVDMKSQMIFEDAKAVEEYSKKIETNEKRAL